MAGLAIITEARIDVKDRACANVRPVRCIDEFDPRANRLFSEADSGSGIIETTRTPNSDAIDVSDEHLPDGSAAGSKYNANEPSKGPRPHVLRPAHP